VEGLVMERLLGVVQPYAWGSPTVIPDLLGVEPSGEPQAELWFGAHPLAPSMAAGEPLDKIVDRDPEAVVGPASVEAFGPRLPFLVKVIAADRPLSLQAHPTRQQAETGYAREEAAGVPRDAPQRTYRDGWPKPEVLCALRETEALCGFRDPLDTYGLFEQLGVARVRTLVAPLDDEFLPAVERLALVFGRLLRLGADQRPVVKEVIAAAAKVSEDSELGRFARTATEIGSFYPEDPGVLAALLMNRMTLRPNEALYLPAGNLHAYLSGGGVEIMANSDNVLRGGLTPKHIDVAELLRVVDFTPGFGGLVTPVEESPGIWHYPTPAPEFALWRLDTGEDPVEVPGIGGGRILLVTQGSAVLSSGAEDLALARGESALLTATESASLVGPATVFVGAPGVV
jgi:mannose-6-phosphate isomerase